MASKLDSNTLSNLIMKKQGYNARLDDALGARNGKKSQSMRARRHESEGMEKKFGKAKFAGNKRSAQARSLMKGTCNLDVKKVASSAAFRAAAAKAKIPIKGDKSRNPNQVQNMKTRTLR